MPGSIRRRLSPALGVLICAVLVVGCASRSPATTQATSASERTAVEAAITTWFDSGLARLDTAAIGRGVTDEFLIFEDTLRLDRFGFLAFVSGLPRMFGGPVTLQYQLGEWNTTVHGDVAWSSLRNRGTVTIGQQPPMKAEWLETAVMRRVGGRWLIDRYHSTMVRGPGKP